MNGNIIAILAIIKKDLVSLLPLVLLALVVFSVEPIVSNLSLENQSEAWVNLSSNFYWLSYLLAIVLMISVLQLDPASSLNHDWLTRPISRTNWILAKLLFLFLFIYFPIVIAQFIVSLSHNYGLIFSIGYAMAIENPSGLLPIPLFFSIGLLTSTLRKTIFLTFIVFLVFISPAWDVPRPLFRFLGMNLSADYDAMVWLQALPMMLTGLITATAIYWLFYFRRKEAHAKIAFILGLTVFFFSMYPPAPLYNWDKALASHKIFFNDDKVFLEKHATPQFLDACFSAVILNNDSKETLVQKAGWFESNRQPEPGGLTFSTRIKNSDIPVKWFSPSNTARNLPTDWLVDRIRVRGRMISDSMPQGVPLRRSFTAINRYAPMSSADTDYWLLPKESIDTFANDPSSRVVLDFDLALLSPTTYELKTDGQSVSFPELGLCRAEINNGANRIDVECLKSGKQPDLLTAELVGVDGSRISSSFRTTTFKPDWLDSIGRKQYELRVKSPHLVDSSVILLNAYQVERIIHKQLVSEGMLGGSAPICPLPTAKQLNAVEKSTWSDKSPHEISSVAVESGVRLEVLDWRLGKQYSTPTLVLLPGLGATAHSYDKLASKLAETYPVVGITRRGIGESSKPDHGYDTARLSQDLIQILKTLEIKTPVLIGHSIGGEELNYLGAHHPEFFSALVYLDAAFDRTTKGQENLQDRQHYHELTQRLPDRPPPRPSELLSYESVIQYAKRLGSTNMLPEGELLATYDFSEGAMNTKIDTLYTDAILMGLQAPNYHAISIPALAIFALDSSPQSSMKSWYDQNDPLIQEAVTELFQRNKTIRTEAITRFDQDIPNSEVVVIEDGDHWIFVSNQDEVIQAIDDFVEKLNDSTNDY